MLPVAFPQSHQHLLQGTNILEDRKHSDCTYVRVMSLKCVHSAVWFCIKTLRQSSTEDLNPLFLLIKTYAGVNPLDRL